MLCLNRSCCNHLAVQNLPRLSSQARNHQQNRFDRLELGSSIGINELWLLKQHGIGSHSQQAASYRTYRNPHTAEMSSISNTRIGGKVVLSFVSSDFGLSTGNASTFSLATWFEPNSTTGLVVAPPTFATLQPAWKKKRTDSKNQFHILWYRRPLSYHGFYSHLVGREMNSHVDGPQKFKRFLICIMNVRQWAV